MCEGKAYVCIHEAIIIINEVHVINAQSNNRAVMLLEAWS